MHFVMTSHDDDQRFAALAKALVQHPERFGSSRLPKKFEQPDKAWINESNERKEVDEGERSNACSPAALGLA